MIPWDSTFPNFWWPFWSRKENGDPWTRPATQNEFELNFNKFVFQTRGSLLLSELLPSSRIRHGGSPLRACLHGGITKIRYWTMQTLPILTTLSHPWELYRMLSRKLFWRWPISKSKLLNDTETRLVPSLYYVFRGERRLGIRLRRARGHMGREDPNLI